MNTIFYISYFYLTFQIYIHRNSNFVERVQNKRSMWFV